MPVVDADRGRAAERSPAPDGLTQRISRRPAGLERRLEHLPDGHPSAPGYRDGPHRAGPGDDTSPGAVPSDRGQVLTDQEHGDHGAEVRALLADAQDHGLASDHQHTMDAERKVWTADRQTMHDALIEDLYRAASAVPCEGLAILAGGLGGAGKSTVLARHAGPELARYLMVNPDDMTRELARRGLIPEIPGLSPMEAADLVHEESSHLAKRMGRRAEADGKNVIWDYTMSTADSAVARVASLRAAGYARIEAVFVDVPVELAVRRADARYREGHEAYRAGEGFGGRYVPAEVIRSQADEVWGSKNRASFERVKTLVDAWFRYDNSGGAAVLAESGGHAGRKESRDERN